MNQIAKSGTSKQLTPAMVESELGLEIGALGSIGWLVLQEMSQGTGIERIAADLGTDESEVKLLIESIVGEGEAGWQNWAQAIAMVKMARRLNDHVIANTWDAVEAMAVEKLASSLSQMRTDGDPLKMLAIAEKANKAIRRSAGDRPAGERSQGAPYDPQNSGGTHVSVTLPAGQQGQIQLNLSPHVQRQLSNPDRVIGGDTNRIGKPRDLTMLRLEDTRRLVEEARPVESGADLNGIETRHNPFDSLRGLMMGDSDDAESGE